MTQTYKKKLIEVAIPLEAINVASVREKSIRHGHPSTLHLWWARRPLAACRAVLFAQLVDDPSSHPDRFLTEEAIEAERKRLFRIIGDLVKWENSTNKEVLERARAEIRASCGGELPPIYDPFSGGGSIPLEAQRLGLPAYGSDLNPVAVMIGKAMIEIPPKFKDMEPSHPGIKDRSFYRNAEGLAEDVKYYGEWMREKAWERIGHLYPQVDLPREYGGGKANVIAWIWARTVPSPDPAFADVHVPLVSSFLLSSKKGKEVWIKPIVDRRQKTITYEICTGGSKEDWAKAKEGTKQGRGAHFRCLMSDTAITPVYVKATGQAGGMKQTLIAIVAETRNGRVYVEPTEFHVSRAFAPELIPPAKECRETFLSGATPERLTGGTCYGYGLDEWGKLFTNRQLVALNTFSDLVHEAREQIEVDALAGGMNPDPTPLRDDGKGAKAYAEAVSVYLYFCIGKLTDLANSLCGWEPVAQCPKHLFGRHAIPMIWDFAEGNILSQSSGSFSVILKGIYKAFDKNTFDYPDQPASIVQSDAASFIAPPGGVIISSDPPYYDNIGYADLSDFFYVWMKKALRPVFPALFGTIAVPKAEELVATPYRHGGVAKAETFFLEGMTDAVMNMALRHREGTPATIFYAFKQSEVDREGIASTGWATFLQAVMNAGFAVLGTWPIRTENASRMIASGTNALANSVVLVCRERSIEADTITRAEFIRALKRELPPAIAVLQAANVSPADMPQSAIGPGMGVFSRCKAVLEADDSAMTVKTALQMINAELDEYLGGIQGEFDPDTRFAINWFEQNGMGEGDYGVADNLARARGIAVESVKQAGIIESQAGRVRILKRDELDPEWEPKTDTCMAVWECLQQLVRSHEQDGVSYNTALLLRKIIEKADAVKDLAYCLYDICAIKRQDAKEAMAYNALIADWQELTREAAAIVDIRGTVQTHMDF